MIELYDTTLRDGTQGEGISLTVQDKLRVTHTLDDFGIHLIEGGWPGSNPKDAEYFERVRKLKLKHARIAAFGSTCRPSLHPQDDENLRALLDAETEVTTVFGKAWTRHVTQVLRTELDNNRRIVEQSVAFLKKAGRRVIFDAEHFFNGFYDDRDYALAVVRAAVDGGADTVVLCDTNGGMLPWQIEEAAAQVRKVIDASLGIHAHNDSGCAVANSLAAVRAGCTHIQGTVNGLGERCGNADLCPITANLELKNDIRVLPEGKLAKLTEVSRFISELANVSHPAGAPYVGRSAFSHKAGVHVAALRRDEGSYEHCRPHLVGNHTRVVVSELSGRGNIRHKADEFGLQDEGTGPHAELLARIKELENQGFAFEAAEASVELMMRRERCDYRPFFELIDFLVVVEHRAGRGHLAEANVKIRVGDQEHHTAADGVGPVGALDRALRKALVDVYPAIKAFRLVDYKVRILDSSQATRAVTRVMIDTTDGEATWTTVGASRNIIEASWQALYDSFEYGLLRASGNEGVIAKKRQEVTVEPA
ncbi:MAG: citramalate synthase [Phycisphaerales bacterium]|nr:MAG: citramalate synthase [Phycisphaerales bacterium]